MTSKKYDFSGKVALITGTTYSSKPMTSSSLKLLKLFLNVGSSGGIGGAVAIQFAKCHAKVVITGHLEADVEKMVTAVEAISGEKPLALVGDLTSDAFAARLVSETVAKYGRIDVLFNNAGRLCPGGSFLDPALLEQFDLLMSLNVRSLVKMTHLCVPHLQRSKGNIINTASIASYLPVVNTVYSTSKAAVQMITKCAAVDLGPLGIRVNSVNPGPIRTPIGASMNCPEILDDPAKNPLVPHTVMKRFGEADEVANLVLYLASSEAEYITGSHFVVDGGYMCL